MMEKTPKAILQRVSLSGLEPDLDNIIVIGIIIGKQRPRKFLDRKNNDNNGNYRAVWNFTLRDSPKDYINVTYWGNHEAIYQADDKFHIGDVVEIIKPKVILRRLNDFGEQFRPMVTSPFSLSLNEDSKITIFAGNVLTFVNLLRLPTKPVAGFVTLRDIHNSGHSMKDEHVDILAAVRNIGTIRNVTTKKGEELQLREVVLFDHTSSGMKLTVWDTNIMNRANYWKPRQTILFITDVRIEWSNFQRSYSVTLSNRSIVTENPLAPEAITLAGYAKSAPLETSAILDQMVNHFPDPNSIQNVMNIQQVHDKVNTFVRENRLGDQQFTALLFAVVTQLDLDGLSPTTKTKCTHCKTLLKNAPAVCENPECPVTKGQENPSFEVSFDIRVMLSDHTGSLTNCRIAGKVAENILGCTVDEFGSMTDDQKCTLKWKYLLERCEVRIMILLVNRRNPLISIISCSIADKIETARRLPIF